MKKNKYFANIAMICIILLASISMYLCYSQIHNAVKANRDTHFVISEYFSDDIRKYNYFIDLNLKKQDYTEDNMQQYLQKSGNPDEAYTNQESFYNYMRSYKIDFNNQEDMRYYAINTKTNLVDTNCKDNLSLINTDQSLKDKYQWYIQYEFATDGTMQIKFASGNEDLLNLGETEKYYPDYSYSDENGSINIQNPKDLTVTYAIEKNIVTDGQLDHYIERNSSDNYFKYSLFYILLISFIVFAVTLVTPYKYLEKIDLFHFLAKIKFEILGFIYWPLIFFMARLSSELIYITATNNFDIIFRDFGINNISIPLIHIINIGNWMIFFFLFMFFAYMIRYFFHKGLKKYFMQNTCVGWIILNMKKIIDFVINFDLSDTTNKSVLRIVAFNFVIITIISVFFVFGIFFSFVYSVIIFILLKKKFNDIKKDYEVLLQAAKKLSSGQFDIQIREDIGIFNPLKQEFSHIKEGFEKAVKEEVKSQRMKTELISNVSHDLKTPLTSIITYVDLLKNNELTLEERDKYLQVLDRNSLRLKNLIDDLFEVSKANSGDIQLELVDVDIIALIKQAQFEWIDKLEEKHLDIRSNFDQEKIICQLDSSKTYRIFENLFINMSKYSLPNTRVYIEVQDLSDKVIITFKNISADEMTFKENEIVERFVQGDKSRNTSGSGLGLAIVKSFTELQHGQFRVETDGDLFKSIIQFNKRKGNI